MEFTSIQEKHIRLYFRISIFFKGLISLAEVLAGGILLVLPASYITGWVIALAQDELAEEPGDFIATHSLALAQQFSVTSGVFIALYLLSRGLIKLLLIAALLNNKLWAYPLSLGVLGLFVAYQVYQVLVFSSALVLLLTIFDLIIMWFIWREYQVLMFERRA
jgi:uncharacterized membrane protein